MNIASNKQILGISYNWTLLFQFPCDFIALILHLQICFAIHVAVLQIFDCLQM